MRTRLGITVAFRIHAVRTGLEAAFHSGTGNLRIAVEWILSSKVRTPQTVNFCSASRLNAAPPRSAWQAGTGAGAAGRAGLLGRASLR